jgi:hypothetical protein
MSGERFQVFITHPGDGFGSDHELGLDENPADRCLPTVEINRPEEGHNVYRSRCLGCGHRGSERASENEASEGGQDHAFPGWRDLPVVASPPTGDGSPKQQAERMAKWVASVTPLLPQGWLERGGPIRTHRKSPGNRHVPSRAPGGGYDMATDEVAGAEREPLQPELF